MRNGDIWNYDLTLTAMFLLNSKQLIGTASYVSLRVCSSLRTPKWLCTEQANVFCHVASSIHVYHSEIWMIRIHAVDYIQQNNVSCEFCMSI